jgi:hypothetical protein
MLPLDSSKLCSLANMTQALRKGAAALDLVQNSGYLNTHHAQGDAAPVMAPVSSCSICCGASLCRASPSVVASPTASPSLVLERCSSTALDATWTGR